MADLEWEAVVVDNASTDGSERAAEGIDRIRLVRRADNIGFAAGMNVGMAPHPVHSCWFSIRTVGCSLALGDS